jgi:hypothetical protein
MWRHHRSGEWFACFMRGCTLDYLLGPLPGRMLHHNHHQLLSAGVDFWWNDEGEATYHNFHWWCVRA